MGVAEERLEEPRNRLRRGEHLLILIAASAESLPFLAVYGGIAVVLGIVLFRITAIAVPMLVDEEVDVLNAIFASWKAVGENARAMTLWTVLIVTLVAIGFATAYLGLIVIVPWLTYASWHAYQDTLIPEERRTTPTEG
jgi:uncharacterized membrane protein